MNNETITNNQTEQSWMKVRRAVAKYKTPALIAISITGVVGAAYHLNHYNSNMNAIANTFADQAQKNSELVESINQLLEDVRNLQA